MELSFSDYLKSKKINEEAFKAALPEEYARWQADFEDTHPDSFTLRKKFLINPYRRRFMLPAEVITLPKE